MASAKASSSDTLFRSILVLFLSSMKVSRVFSSRSTPYSLDLISYNSFLSCSSFNLLFTSSSIRSSIPFSPATPAASPTAAPRSSGWSSFFFSNASASYFIVAALSSNSFLSSNSLRRSTSTSFLISSM